MDVSTRDGYDLWASIYDEGQRSVIVVDEELTPELLGPVSGLRTLELGCGTGRYAVPLAAQGATVTGLDFSEGMLERARRKALDRGVSIELATHDLEARLPFDEPLFDRVLCTLVLDHVRDLRHVFGEMRRVCRRDGRVVVTTMHPAVLLKGLHANFVDPNTGREVRLTSYPHQVSDFVLAISRAGLRIEGMYERFGNDDLAARVPAAARFVGWPLLLAFDLRPD